MRLKQKVTLCVRSPKYGSHAPPGASHNVSFCSTGGTRLLPSSPLSTPPAAANRVRCASTPAATHFSRGPGCGASTPCRGGRPAASVVCLRTTEKTNHRHQSTHHHKRRADADESGTAFHSLAASLAEFRKRNYAHSAPSLLHALPCDKAGSLRQPSRQETCHAGCELRSPGRDELRALCLSEAGRGGASESKVFFGWRASNHFRVITTTWD